MTTDVFTVQPIDWSSFADKTLKAATRFWFAVAVIGQWAFLYYIVAFYGPSTLEGDFARWNVNRHLFKGYVQGDTAGNLAFAAHALLAGVIAFGGALQLIPQLRTRAMTLHRWNGRLFNVTALAVSVTGLYMVWVRGATMSPTNSIGVSLNGVLIIVFAIFAWRTAIAHDVAAHRRWALRTYLVANGQWFVRVGFFTWIIVSHGQLVRPFFRFWVFGCYLVPLAILELYLRTKDDGAPRERFAMAGVLTLLTLLMTIGIAGVAMFLYKTVLVKA